MPATIDAPDESELRTLLGRSYKLWSEIIGLVERACGPVERLWTPAKTDFGRTCRLQYRKRTIIYLIPEKGKLLVAIVLGNRAYELAMASDLSTEIKQRFADARPYAEGRGIRFAVASRSLLGEVEKLVALKIAT